MSPYVRQPRILVVDDEPNVLETVEAVLELEGYAVDVAGGQVAAEERLGASSYDLVVTDLRLDDGEGNAVIGAVERRHPGTPVIVLTAAPSAEVTRARGIRDLLFKPCDAEVLRATVRRALGFAA